MTSVYTGLMSAAGASEKIFEYLDIKPELQITRSYEPDRFHGAIEFKNVHFTYPTRPDMPILRVIFFLDLFLIFSYDMKKNYGNI